MYSRTVLMFIYLVRINLRALSSAFIARRFLGDGVMFLFLPVVLLPTIGFFLEGRGIFFE